MTRKDYRALAACFKMSHQHTRIVYSSIITIDTLKDLRERIMHVMKANNSNFDRDKFKKACGF